MITDFRLRVFRTAAEKLSFTRAASELFITQPAVTKHVGELERQLGVALFLRRGGTISLTPEGERLLGYARRILSLYGELNEAFAPDGAVPGGEIALGASTTLSQYVLPAVLSRFRKRYADIRVTVADGNTERIERLVADERIDVGLIEGQAARPSLRYETFMQDELVLVTSAGNRSLGRDGMCAADPRDGLGHARCRRARSGGQGPFAAVAEYRNAARQHREHQALSVRLRSGGLSLRAGHSGRAASWIVARNRSARLVRYALFQLRFPARPPQSSGRFVRALLRPSYPFGKLTPRSCRAWDSDKAFAGDLGSMSGKILQEP